MSTWRDELRHNPRLRIGLLALLGVLWLIALLELSDSVDRARAEQGRLVTELERLRDVARESRWPAFRDDVNQRLADHRSLTWREESEGRMQALLQDWLREQFARADVQPRELVVSVLPLAAAGESRDAQGAGLPPEMRIVRARASFDFQPETLHRLLGGLASSRQWIWVERLNVDNGSRRRVELELESLFTLGPRGTE